MFGNLYLEGVYRGLFKVSMIFQFKMGRGNTWMCLTISTLKKLRSWHPVPSLHGKWKGKHGNSDRFYLWGGLQNHCRWWLQPCKKMLTPWKKSYDQPRQHIWRRQWHPTPVLSPGKIPWTEEPGGLQSMGSQRVGHDWATSLSLSTLMHWRRKWQPSPVFLPGESQGWGSLVGCCLWGRTELDMTEAT